MRRHAAEPGATVPPRAGPQYVFLFSRDWSRCGIKSCTTLRINKYGINPGISGIYPIPAAESKVGYIPPFWHATVWLDRASWFAPNPCRRSRQTRIGQVAPRRVSAAHLGWVRAAALLPRGGPCPPGGHCAALDGPTRLRSPSTRSPRSGARGSDPNSHPSTHGRDAPGDAIDRGHMEIKNTVQSRVRICLIYTSLFLCA